MTKFNFTHSARILLVLISVLAMVGCSKLTANKLARKESGAGTTTPISLHAIIDGQTYELHWLNGQSPFRYSNKILALTAGNLVCPGLPTSPIATQNAQLNIDGYYVLMNSMNYRALNSSEALVTVATANGRVKCLDAADYIFLNSFEK